MGWLVVVKIGLHLSLRRIRTVINRGFGRGLLCSRSQIKVLGE
jgi:hypothetical protein